MTTGRPAPARPVLARLARVPAVLLQAREAVVPRRAAVTALCLQLVLLPAFALFAAARPYDALWLRLALATWLVWLWPLVRLAQVTGAWRPRARHDRIRIRKTAEVAAELDRLNPAAPDIFRTALHPDDHAPATLDALETLYAAWEPRLCFPETPTVFGGANGNAAGRARRWSLAACAVFALTAAALPLLLPRALGTPGGVLYRMALPLRALRALPAPRLQPIAVPARIVRGDTLAVVVLTAHVPPGRPVHARVQARRGGDEVRHVLRRNAAGDTAWFRFGPVTADLDVRFTVSGARTRTYPVRVVAPPRLQALSAVVTPPAYTRLPPETFADFPPVLAVLPGTRIVWKGEADRPLQAWEVLWGADPVSHGSGARFGFSRVLREAGDLTVRLVEGAEEGGGRALEGPWRIDLKADAPPEVALLSPASDGELARALKVALLFRATDDFGVARVTMHYTVSREDRGAEPASASVGARSGEKDVSAWRDAGDGTGGGVWDVAGLHPEPGDVVELYLEAEDNNAVSGRQRARSATVRLRLPSAEEARAAVEERERGAATSLASALERERRVRQEESKAERPDRASTLEAPPVAGEGDVRRILSDQPRQHLQEVRAQVEAELRALRTLKAAPPRQAGGQPGGEAEPPAAKTDAQNKALEKKLEELKKETVEMEKRLPPPEVAAAPIPEQKKRLEALGKDQKALEKKLAASRPAAPVPPQIPQKTAREEQARRENRARLEEDLQRNLKDQKDLQNWLEERERASAAQQKRAEEAARNDERMRQDVEKALDQVKEAMEKGLENGNLTPDLLEKMDRVRELLEEVLDEGEKERLRREAGDERPEAEDVQRAVRNLLEKKDGMRQELERAIRMLEALREMRAFKELTGEMRELEKDQRTLAAALGEEPRAEGASPAEKAAEAAREAGERAEEQKMLAKRLDQALQEMDRFAKNPSMRSLKKDEARKAREAMQKAADKLNEKKPDRKASKEGADLAAKHLKAAAEQMEKMAAQMNADDAGSGRVEMRALLEETLEFARWLTPAGDLVPPAPPSWSPAAVPGAAAAARVAKWLAARMVRLAEKQPFETDVLRREASALSAAADAVSTPNASAPGVALAVHARGAARELLKLLNQPQNGDGSEEGDGQGESDLGGGETGESGQEGLSGRMRGISGRQMAANQLTQELLRELLQQRQESGAPGGKDPSGSSGSSGASGKPKKPGAGQDGSQGTGGSGGGEGADGSSGSQGTEGANGSDGGNSANSGRAGKAANAQQKIAEALESLAESADDAGGAARKLRQLAAEARALEKELRGPRLDPETLRKRQEQFRTRLLETTDALEERGQRQERRAEAWTGGVRIPEKTGSLGMDSLALELKRRRAEARKLPLSPAQKQRVEWYYERLLGP